MTPFRRSLLTPIACSAALVFTFASAGLQAQDAQVKINKVSLDAQKTPSYNVDYVTDKRSKPREWLEIETEFEGKLADRDKDFISALTFKYYVILNPKTRDEQTTLTADVTYQNIPVDDKARAVAYISPSSIQKITGKKGVSSSDVQYWGIEVLYGGEVVGTESSNGKPWWTSEKAPPKRQGQILTKGETPFAPLWADYHVDVAEKN